MPPEERLVPRFAAEPPQDTLPYGRWEERLREEFLAAASSLEGEAADPGQPGPISWYPDRGWQGRPSVPATAPTPGGYGLSGYVRYIPAGEGSEPSDFLAVA